MSEELTFQERCFYIQEDFTVQCEIRDFIDTIQNERLAEGLRHLTDRQRQVIELYFWKGYQCKEIATMFGCSPAAVTDLMHRVYKRLRVCPVSYTHLDVYKRQIEDCQRTNRRYPAND